MGAHNRLILIGNYLPDRQESMIRFAKMLKSGFENEGIWVDIWWPTSLVGSKSKSTTQGLGKWLGYIDKYIIFPIVIHARIILITLKKHRTHFHICDHSNAPYLKHLPVERTAITCHDVIAIRGGLGFSDSYQPASQAGKVLQRWILNNLVRAKRLAAVSRLTLKQLNELAVSKVLANDKRWSVIENGFNASFKQVERSDANRLLKQAGLNPETLFILHVGSALPRKNRKILLEMAAVLDKEWSGSIYFAGEELNEELTDRAGELGLTERVISIVKPDHDTLVALYNTCEAFIFPSLSEGFGWPVIEAQACGTPVIASNIEPMPEISGGAALHVHATDPKEFANAFLSLRNKDVRTNLIERGFKNILRFDPKVMANAYLKLHEMI